MRCVIAACLLLLLLPATSAEAEAQTPNTKAVGTTVPYEVWRMPDRNTAVGKRQLRELAVSKLGGDTDARQFVETYGENAVAAVERCSPEVGKQLAAWHADPDGLSRLPRPGDLLRVIGEARLGDDVARYAMKHSRELRDVDSFEALLSEPMDLSMELKPLARAASESRARRLAVASAGVDPGKQPLGINQWQLIGAGAAGLVILALWLRSRRDREEESPRPGSGR